MSELHTGELVTGLVLLVTAINAIIWTTFHCYNMYQDLYTMDRKCLKHRTNVPKMSPLYRSISWLTTIAIIGYSGAVVSTAAIGNFSILYVSCRLLTMLNSILWQIGKSFMFLTYILRLHQCYALSAFGYGKKKLYCVAIFVCLLTLMTAVAIVVGVLGGTVNILDNDGKWPYHCAYKIHETWQAIVAFGVIIFDIILTIGAVVAFQVPINRLFKALASTKTAVSSGVHSLTNTTQKKMLYAGYKYKVCVICASITSLFWILLAFAGELPYVVSILANVDWTINLFCLMLMTPYYPDAKYYRKLCGLCIFCCDREKQSYQNSAVDLTSTPQEDTVATTVGSGGQPARSLSTISNSQPQMDSATDLAAVSSAAGSNSDLEKSDKEIEQSS